MKSFSRVWLRSRFELMKIPFNTDEENRTIIISALSKMINESLEMGFAMDRKIFSWKCLRKPKVSHHLALQAIHEKLNFCVIFTSTARNFFGGGKLTNTFKCFSHFLAMIRNVVNKRKQILSFPQTHSLDVFRKVVFPPRENSIWWRTSHRLRSWKMNCVWWD